MANGTLVIIATMLAMIAFAIGGCGSKKPSEFSSEKREKEKKPIFSFENKPSNLKKLVERLNVIPKRSSAAQISEMAQLARGLLADEQTIKLAFKPGAVTHRIRRNLGILKGLSKKSDFKLACLFLPKDRTWKTVRVYSTKVRNLAAAAAYEDSFRRYRPSTPRGSVPSQVKVLLRGRPLHEKFSGPWVAAPRYLRSDLTIHQVEITDAKGARSKMLHLFVWDGKQWKTLGPFWSTYRMRRFAGLPNIFFPKRGRRKQKAR